MSREKNSSISSVSQSCQTWYLKSKELARLYAQTLNLLCNKKIKVCWSLRSNSRARKRQLRGIHPPGTVPDEALRRVQMAMQHDA